MSFQTTHTGHVTLARLSSHLELRAVKKMDGFSNAGIQRPSVDIIVGFELQKAQEQADVYIKNL